MSKADELFKTYSFSHHKKEQQLFLESFRETALHHYLHNELIKVFWDEIKLHPKDLKNEQDLTKVPPILVNVFKENELVSVAKKEIVLTLTSSGTGGQKSQMFLDQASLDNVKTLAYKIYQDLGMTSPKKYNYLCFTYDPKVAHDLGTAFTDELLTNFTGKNEVYYAIQWDKSKQDFKLNEKGVIETLKRFQKSKFPTRILGFPAFLYKLIVDHNIKINLGKDSWLQTGGGWKNHQDQEISKIEFRSFIHHHLGIPEKNIRDLFGMVEHGIPYVDCEKGNLHVPNYARVYIRDPKNLSLVKDGEIGLMHFLCSYNTSYPSHSLLTTDWGRIGKCNCAIGGKTLEVMGRAGVSKHRGCALKSLELLK